MNESTIIAVTYMIFVAGILSFILWIEDEPKKCPKCKSYDIEPIGFYSERHRCKDCNHKF